MPTARSAAWRQARRSSSVARALAGLAASMRIVSDGPSTDRPIPGGLSARTARAIASALRPSG
ncbi:MAG: hypothetical protein QXG65_02670 [Thermoplasmata archaeon]